ncbi:MAG TPA: response regulator, partial [Verrucomicrobiae bacterium]|nr:response regulator [Verrucomicrobiae bacterium]
MLITNTSTDSKNIFLVGDDSSTVDLYRSRLEQAGFRTASAFDAAGAFEALPNLSADLIILDLMLPKSGGFELLEAIRSDNRHRDTPVLVLSNVYLPEMAQKALRAGGNKALTKSECTSSELISVSRELVGIAETGGTDQPAAVGMSQSEDTPTRRPIEGPADAGLAEQLKKSLIAGGSTEVAALRQHCLRYAEVVGSEESKEHLDKVYQSVRSLSARAGLAGCGKIAQLTGAIEAMLFDQVFRVKSGMSGSGPGGRVGTTGRTAEAAPQPGPAIQVENHKFDTALKIAHYRMSPSSIQTLVQAVDCLDRLFTSGNTGSAELSCKARVLQVDDDAVCIMANEVAFKRVNYDTVSATDGSAALDLLNDNTFDLILLDINLPGMNGIELCQRLRGIPRHKHTPVIFVTLYDDFQNRAQSLLSGGDDVISKPISPFELIVKATVFLLSTSKPRVPQVQRHLNSPTSPPGAVAASLPAARSETTLGGGSPPSPDQIWITSDSPSANDKPDAGSQSQSLMAEQSKLEGRTKKLHTVQATFDEKLNNLREALAEETKRREAVEQQAAENVERRSKLEAAIEENQRAQEWFRQLLEESQQPAQPSEPSGAAGQVNLAGRRRALEQVRDFVADKQILLKQALAAETKRREAVEQQAAENAKRRADLETALGEIQQAQDAFQQELETADNPKQLLELETALGESQQAREKVEGELGAARRELQTLRRSQAAQESELEARTKALQASQAEVEQKIRTVTEALTAEAGQSATRQSELETELARYKQAQAQLRQELEEAQKQRQAHQASAAAEQSRLEARLQELQVAQGEVEQQVGRLKEALAAETIRRETVKQRAAEHAKCRSELEAALAENEQTEKTLQREMEASDRAKGRGELEAQLAENKQTQAQLRHELEAAHQQQQAQLESSRAEQTRLEARTRELRTAGAEVEQQVQRLKEAVTEETRRREEARQQAVEIEQRRSELEAELGRLRQQLEEARNQQQAQQESSRVEQSKLEARTEELQANRTTAEERIKSLVEALAAETRRREAAEQQAAQLAKRQSELEAELAENKRVQAELQLELEEAQKQLRVQAEGSRAEQSRLEARTKELQAAQAGVEQKVRQVTETLAEETRRREGAEQQAAEIGRRRSELEAELGQLAQRYREAQEQLQAETQLRHELQQAEKQLVRFLQLAENKQAQEHVRQQLEEAQKQLQVQRENYLAEQSRLETRTRELQAAQAEAEQKAASLAEMLA